MWYLEKYRSTVQKLAHMGWLWLNRQEELLTEEGEEAGDGRAEGWSAIAGGGQDAISLTPEADGTGSCSLLDLVLSTLLSQRSSCQHLLDHQKSKRVPEKHLYLLY